MGKVKNLHIIKRPTKDELGVGVFEFTDDYSIFDYGKMPDVIDGKGESLCRMSSDNFIALKKMGIKSHFRKSTGSNKMEVDLVRVLYPGRDEITSETTNYLIPLEIIFRNSLPPGSSVFKALEKGEIKPEDIGLKKMPKPGDVLENPIIDLTTKLEDTDRRVREKEAKQLAALSDDEMERLKEIALKINDFITNKAESIGLEHADGKIELGLGPDREIIVVDVFGTLDEDRFLYNKFHISKQVLRDFYKKTEWYQELEKAKNSLPKDEWPEPARLPPELISAVSGMYKSVCEMWIKQKIWNASLPRSIDSVKKFV